VIDNFFAKLNTIVKIDQGNEIDKTDEVERQFGKL